MFKIIWKYRGLKTAIRWWIKQRLGIKSPSLETFYYNIPAYLRNKKEK